MIQPNDLRIGNLVETIYKVKGKYSSGATADIYPGSIDKIESISNDGSITVSDMNNLIQIRFISLTVKNLLKCGFKAVNNEALFGIPPGEEFYRIIYQVDSKKCPLILKLNNGVLCHVVPSDGFYGCAFKPVQYLHQLQNLYFALTGKELEVDL